MFSFHLSFPENLLPLVSPSDMSSDSPNSPLMARITQGGCQQRRGLLHHRRTPVTCPMPLTSQEENLLPGSPGIFRRWVVASRTGLLIESMHGGICFCCTSPPPSPGKMRSPCLWLQRIRTKRGLTLRRLLDYIYAHICGSQYISSAWHCYGEFLLVVGLGRSKEAAKGPVRRLLHAVSRNSHKPWHFLRCDRYQALS